MTQNTPGLRLRKQNSIYMTREALTLRNRKTKLWRRFASSQDGGDHARFVRARNDLRTLTRKLRRNFEMQLTDKLRTNVKPFWQYVNSRLKTKSGIGDLKRSDGSTASTDQEKAEVLSEFFSSVFTAEDCSDVPCPESEWEGPVLDKIEVTPQLIEQRLRGLRTSTSPGPDEIPARVLCELATPLSIPVCSLFTKSLGSGQLPYEWKLGSVVPIHKGGSRQEPSNYRPISLTSVLSKVLEGVVRDGLMEFLAKTGQLHDAQHGFQCRRSCATQLLSSMEDWMKLLEKGTSGRRLSRLQKSFRFCSPPASASEAPQSWCSGNSPEMDRGLFDWT